MFESCKDKNELQEEAKRQFHRLRQRMDGHVFNLLETTNKFTNEDAALMGIVATANETKRVCEAYINKADELEKHKSQSENNDFTKGFILGMTWAALMSDDEECD